MQDLQDDDTLKRNGLTGFPVSLLSTGDEQNIRKNRRKRKINEQKEPC